MFTGSVFSLHTCRHSGIYFEGLVVHAAEGFLYLQIST